MNTTRAELEKKIEALEKQVKEASQSSKQAEVAPEPSEAHVDEVLLKRIEALLGKLSKQGDQLVGELSKEGDKSAPEPGEAKPEPADSGGGKGGAPAPSPDKVIIRRSRGKAIVQTGTDGRVYLIVKATMYKGVLAKPEEDGSFEAAYQAKIFTHYDITDYPPAVGEPFDKPLPPTEHDWNPYLNPTKSCDGDSTSMTYADRGGSSPLW